MDNLSNKFPDGFLDNLPKGFLEIMETCAADQKKYMMVYLNNDISSSSKKVFEPKNVNYNDYVEQVKGFVADSVLRDTIISEVTDMGLFNKLNTNKDGVRTQWFSTDNRPYCFSDSNRSMHGPKSISQYPAVCKLVSMVNKDDRTTKDGSTALIQVYNSRHSALGFIMMLRSSLNKKVAFQ